MFDRKVKLFGKSIPVALIILLSVGAVAGAALAYISGLVTVENGTPVVAIPEIYRVSVDQGDSTWQEITIINRSDSPENIELDTTIQGVSGTTPGELSVTYSREWILLPDADGDNKQELSLAPNEEVVIEVIITASWRADPGTYAVKTDILKGEIEVNSKPTVTKRLAIAHYMTGMLPFRGGEALWIDPQYYDPSGPTSQIGGAMLTAPIPTLLHRSDVYPSDLTAEEAILLELKAAKRFGLDGFDFYYPWTGTDTTMRRYNDIIVKFFEVAKEENIDFKFTITVSHPSGGEREYRIQSIGESIGDLVDRVGEDNPHWLRTPENRLFFYTWLPDVLYYGWEGHQTPNNPKMIENTAEAFDRIAKIAGVDADWMYDLHYATKYPADKDYVDAALEHFRGVKGWVTDACNQEEIWDYVAERAHQLGNVYSQEVCGDFCTGKLFTDWPSSGIIYTPQEASEVQMDEVMRWWKVFNLTKNFRRQLELAKEREADMINLTTWNDYPEGHHLAPEINHNFGFAQLFQYGVAHWRDRPEDAPSDIVIVSFKKYPWGATPDPFNIGGRVDEVCGDPSVEDVIEVITILKEPGEVKIDGHDPIQVGAGMSVMRVEMKPGHVSVKVTRNGKVVAELTTPEAITEHPFRTDRLTYTFSSSFREIYESLYGENAPIYSSNQYATENLVDGPK